MSRETIEFVISGPIVGKDAEGKLGTKEQWLTAQAEWGAEPEAITFKFLRSPTPLERHRMDKLMHEYAGGLSEFLDMVHGINNAEKVILAQMETIVWPEGRPTADADDEMLAQVKLLDEQWKKHGGEAMDGWRILTGLRDRLAFLSLWTVMAVDPAEEWRTLADREIPEATFSMIWGAYNAAMSQVNAAKRPSSEP